MTFNPKKDFCDDVNRRKQWVDISASKVFNEAIAAAFVVQQQSTGRAPDMATAAANAWQLEGAKQFALILMNLADPQKPAEQQPSTALNYKV